MIYIGIDTGVHTGVAVWNSEKKIFMMVETMQIHQAMDIVRTYRELDKNGLYGGMLVRVEDPRKRTWFGTERMSRNMERKRLQGVGSVKRDASIWEDFLADEGIDFQMVAPKENVTKLKADTFKSITGWKKRTNEHCRDAAMLVFQL